MIAYIDSSVLLRLVLRQPDRLRELGKIQRAISSKLLRVECHHVATSPFDTPLNPLAALHLATARINGAEKRFGSTQIHFATHDPTLARAAREMRFDVIGS